MKLVLCAPCIGLELVTLAGGVFFELIERSRQALRRSDSLRILNLKSLYIDRFTGLGEYVVNTSIRSSGE